MYSRNDGGEVIDKYPCWKRLVWWTLFAASFGYIEAAVVVYLRQLMAMPEGMDYQAIMTARGQPLNTAHFTLLLRQKNVFSLELGREVATLLLLFSASWAAGRTTRERWGLFGYTFAVWDLTYYVYLTIWIGFPRSLLATDVYFLVPITWYGPIWFPVLVVMPGILFASLALLGLIRSRR